MKLSEFLVCEAIITHLLATTKEGAIREIVRSVQDAGHLAGCALFYLLHRRLVPILAACEDIRETYQRSGFGPAMAKFIVLVSFQGPLPADYTEQPAPDPAMFGLPAEDDGSRNDPLVGQNIITCNAYQHDFGALRAASTRIVIGVGAQSEAILAGRAAVAVAERLGTSPVTFPGGHDGFLGGEYGSTGEPDAFAATLRTVLAS